MLARTTRVGTVGAIACAFAAVACGTSGTWQPEQVSKPPEKPPASPTAKALEVLKADEGTWDAAISFWFKPDAEPVTSHASLTARMDLGGMFLEQRFEGAFGPEMGNKPYTTLSHTGFNPTTGEYEAVRMASTHSTMIVVRGKARPDGSIELAGEYMFMGGKATERDVIRHEGADKCVIECWMSFGGVPEYKGAEMVLTREKQPATEQRQGEAHMNLGNFSVSLAVKDIAASRAFYEKLDFRVIMGDQAKNWLILQNETATIGLFQGMFDRNGLTFNPGWDRSSKTLPAFDDVRDIQRTLVSRGLTLTAKADESTSGPASLMLLDPDGNPVLIDQHVPKPKK